MRSPVILMALALPVLTVADRAPSPGARTAPDVASMPAVEARYSPEQLQRLRQSLVAQIAVRDAAEGLRPATDQEAASLVFPAPGPARTVALPGGGTALRMDVSQLSLAVAELDADGRVHVSEQASNGASVTAKGGPHVR